MTRETAETAAYFDEHVPEYSLKWLASLLDFLKRTATPDSSLIEIGCGVGNVLEAIRARTPIRTLWGCDISQKCLDKARARVDCTTLHGSILDRDVLAPIQGRFDYVLLASVLHHLVGRTRRESMAFAAQALHNAVSLLKPGGNLLVLEPVYGRSVVMDLLFYGKRAVTRITSRRLGILGYNNNIGAPVVSYLTRAQLHGMTEAVENATIRTEEVVERRIGRLMRLAGVNYKADVSLIVSRR